MIIHWCCNKTSENQHPPPGVHVVTGGQHVNHILILKSIRLAVYISMALSWPTSPLGLVMDVSTMCKVYPKRVQKLSQAWTCDSLRVNQRKSRLMGIVKTSPQLDGMKRVEIANEKVVQATKSISAFAFFPRWSKLPKPLFPIEQK